MKKNIYNVTITRFLLVAIFLIGYNSCTINEVEDPNFPSISSIEEDASVDEMNNVVIGMLSGMRNSFDTYIDDCSIIGRDYYRFSSADPRFTSDLPGVGEAVLDNNTFYIVNPWTSFYRVIRNGWVLRHAVANTSATITQEQKNGYLGFAKTMQALEFHYALNLTYENGIRTDVEDPNNLGPIVEKTEALSFIAALLDEAYADLTSAGSSFIFPLSSGFAGFETPQTFAQYNRALKARIDIYQQNYTQALTDLTTSFYNLAGDFYMGTYITYSTGSGDIPNPLYIALPSSASNARVAQDLWVLEADSGDLRLSKVQLRDEPATVGELTSNYDVNVWKSQNDPVTIIRNEELILIAAEAYNYTGDFANAVTCINTIREAWGLPAYAGAQDQISLRDEILKQRRYSLFAEGHRWIDMRRFNLLNEIETDNPDENVWQQFDIPASEPIN